MSAAEIIKELPKLSHAERREIANHALELNWDEAEHEAIAFSEASALESFKMMDALEPW